MSEQVCPHCFKVINTQDIEKYSQRLLEQQRELGERQIRNEFCKTEPFRKLTQRWFYAFWGFVVVFFAVTGFVGFVYRPQDTIMNGILFGGLVGIVFMVFYLAYKQECLFKLYKTQNGIKAA